MMVLVRWWGHACFEIAYEGRVLVIDPHDGGSLGVGIEPPRVRADYVLVTHNHYDHNAVDVVRRDGTVVVSEREGDFQLGPYRVRGVKLPHDEFEGRLRGHVVAYRVEAGGLAILHLSDLGRKLRVEEAEKLKPVDVVLLPAGGVYTLHPRQALESAELLEARLVIPMHYWVPGIHLPLEPIDTLLRYAKKWRVVRLDTNELEVSREELPEQRTIVVLREPWRRS
jgi:L-ascorbate metabolism protein UlaG (beta-lactamase superfamily)